MRAFGGLLAVLALCFAVVVVIGAIKQAIDPYDTCEDGGRYAAMVAIQHAVEQRLFNPASADFPSGHAARVKYLRENAYRLTSYVDAGNMYGGTIRIRFTGEAVCYPESQRWQVFNLRLH